MTDQEEYIKKLWDVAAQAERRSFIEARRAWGGDVQPTAFVQSKLFAQAIETAIKDTQEACIDKVLSLPHSMRFANRHIIDACHRAYPEVKDD